MHIDPAVVGRKSGAPEMVNDDICTIATAAGWLPPQTQQPHGTITLYAPLRMLSDTAHPA